MTHDEFLNLLSARIDGELPTEEVQRLQEYLQQNPDAAIIAEAFASQNQELRQAFEPHREAAKQVASRVANQLEETAQPARRTSPKTSTNRSWPYFVAASVAIVFTGILFLWKPWQQSGSNNSTSITEEIVDATQNGLKPRRLLDAPKVQKVAVGHRVDTAGGERKRLQLPDGSILYLNQKTSIQVKESRTVELQAGELFVEAVPANSAKGIGSFVVTTPHRQVKALGTKFAVHASTGKTSVLVTQGSVQVDGAKQPLLAGQQLFASAQEIGAVEPAPRATHLLDWTRDLMAQSETPLVPAGRYSGGGLVAVDPYGQEAKLSLVKYHIDVHVEDGFARTTIDQTYFNSENFQMEGTFYFPLPPDASMSRLAMYVEGDLMEGGMAEREHARETYEQIRYTQRDPALLEWVDGSTFKMRVFPLEARQEKRIILSYTQKLPVMYNRLSYRFPAGHTLAVVKEWSFHALIKNGAELQASSPSHPNMKPTIQGSDLILKDAATGIKIDRDVVLEMVSSQPVFGEQALWSYAEHEGSRYLMLRYRPDLPTQPQRQRRDWVFLFEASGARDPLVARTQVEVIRSMLRHAEHDDTFNILTVGTRVHTWNPNMMSVNAENVESAIAFLEQIHLIGALHLEKGLQEAKTYLQAVNNPYLVHVGSGIASLGESNAENLIKQIAPNAKYVGVAVGKQISTQFMKPAAEKTGGFYTQINPDESISWRAFELVSTLNTPTLMNAHVMQNVDGPYDVLDFKLFSNIITHGEEIACVVKLPQDPSKDFKSVRVQGLLNGTMWHKDVPVEQVRTKADYLPRMWAKLEIDRLSQNAPIYKNQIIELSKQMYVMSPFTSLLVLENEAMYQQFKVDRGRKDHWAMYPCPNKIPVVYIPDPNQLGHGRQPNLKGQKPHENQVMQSIYVRRPPVLLNWPGRDNSKDGPYLTAGQLYGGAYAVPRLEDTTVRWDNYFLHSTEEETPDSNSPAKPSNQPSNGLEDFRAERVKLHSQFINGYLGDLSAKSSKDMMILDRKKAFHTLMLSDDESLGRSSRESFIFDAMARRNKTTLAFAERITTAPFSSADFLGRESDEKGKKRSRRSTRGLTSMSRTRDLELIDRLEDRPFDNRFAGDLSNTTERFYSYQEGLSTLPVSGVFFKQNEFRKSLEDGNFQGEGLWNNGRTTLRLRSSIYAQQSRLRFMQVKEFDKELKEALPEIPLESPAGGEVSYWIGQLQAPQYYNRPSFTYQQRIFTDLVSYAPGMSSSPADIQMILEQEAAPRSGQRRGQIDPKAKQLIDQVRASGWRKIRIPTGKDTYQEVLCDGAGRFSYQQAVQFGLIEQVYCDGNRLLHLYPEIGVGAKRVVSKFHRADWANQIPDLLLPAEELNLGLDLKFVEPNIIALVPMKPESITERNPEFRWIEQHLVMDKDRLAERRWIIQPEKQLLSQQVFDADGTIRWLDKEGKEKHKIERQMESTPQPNLKLDLSKLVVLPMPLRNRYVVYSRIGLDPNRGLFDDTLNRCFPYLDEEAKMELLACEWIENQGSNLRYVIDYCFPDDNRLGLDVLLLSTGQTVGKAPVWQDQAKDNPLARYLWHIESSWFKSYQPFFGMLPGPKQAEHTTFLDRLDTFYCIEYRLRSTTNNHRWLGIRGEEINRIFDFIRANAQNPLGWSTMCILQDQIARSRESSQTPEVWGLLAEQSPFYYHGCYEQARSLYHLGRYEESEQKFLSLFVNTLKEGILPSVETTFRSVLSRDETGEKWPKLMKQTAGVCIEKKYRSIVIQLAWQCRQLGDYPLAETLLQMAMKDLSNRSERIQTTLMVIEYLLANGDVVPADRMMTELLQDSEIAKSPLLWRMARQIADQRGQTARSVECLEKALDLEFAEMPDVVALDSIRQDYGRLLQHYQWLVDAANTLNVAIPKDLASRAVRAADRWRMLDPESSNICDQASRILRKIGGEQPDQLAWDYLTTPLAQKPNESHTWLSLASSLSRDGNHQLADQCYDAAYKAEPTNAQILWDRAQHLIRQGAIAESRTYLRQITEKDWQPRFNWLKSQAKEMLVGQ